MKSIQDAKVETAFNHAFTFYKQNGRSVESQESCIQQIAQMTGFDRATCIEIQAPVLSILMYNDTMDIANQVIQQHLNIVTGIIRGRLLDINNGNVQEEMKEQAQVVTKYVSKTPAYTAQEMVGWLEHTNNTQNLNFNLPYKEINLSGKSVTNEDMVFFASRMKNFAFHLDSLQLNHNPISDYGIQALFNCTFTAPLGRSVVHLKLNNCNFGDVGAELIAAYVRDGYMPARSIDVSGNKITEVGQKCFSMALKSEAVNFIAITLESHAGRDAVVDFLKKGSSYYFKEFVNRFENNIDTQYIKTDEDSAFMHCKEGVPKAVVGVTLGIAKCTNPIAKIINSLPQPGEKVPFVTKAVNKLGLFACVMSEEGDNIVTPDLVGCVTEVNAYLGFGHDDF